MSEGMYGQRKEGDGSEIESKLNLFILCEAVRNMNL